jgi:hypothetical protein
MEKRKLISLYIVLGIIAFLGVNFPILGYFDGVNQTGIPSILIYLCVFVACLAGIAFWISKQTEKEE